MRELRATLRDLLPATLRERYHRHALRRDFGIDRLRGSRRPTSIDSRRLLGLNVIGYFESQSGVGQSARSIAEAAEHAGIPITRVEAAGAPRSRGAENPYDVNLYHVNADGADATVEALGPGLHSGRANIAYWYWESDRFPERWRDRFDYFDEIWVASEFCRGSIAAMSPVPVALVPPAVVVESRANAKATAGIDPSAFLFLTMLDALSVPERKNPVGAVRAFARAFSGSREPLLLVLVSNADREPGLLLSLREASRGARVEFREDALTREGVETLLSACDAYVSLHRAEGFGFPIAEAMAAGKPVVATGYSGNADYLNESTGFPVSWNPFTIQERIRDYDAGTRWAEPNEDNAVAQMQRVYADREERERRAARAQCSIAERYGLEPVGKQIAARLENLRRQLRKTA